MFLLLLLQAAQASSTMGTWPAFNSTQSQTPTRGYSSESMPRSTPTILTLAIVYGDFGLWFYNKNGMYEVYTSMRENVTVYSYHLEPVENLLFDGNYTLNQQSVNIVQQKGTVTPPRWLQKLLTPINTVVVEELELCYNFSTERISLKVVIGILGALLLASHGTKVSTAVGAIGRDLQQSKFARRFSRSRSSVAGSETSYTTIKKEASV